MRLSGKFIYLSFFMKRLIHVNKTQGFLCILLPHAFLKDLHINIKNKVFKERLFTCRLSIEE